MRLFLLLAPLLLLLQPRGPMLAGADPAKRDDAFPYCPGACAVCGAKFALWQPCAVPARASEAALLPCAFRHSWGAAREVQVSWHVGGFWSRIKVFNTTATGDWPVHANFSGRVSLVGDLSAGNASLRIRDLRQADANLYFCRVAVLTEEGGRQQWQGVTGTNLTVAGAEEQRGPPDALGPALGAAGVLAALSLLGLGLFLARRRGSCRRPPTGRSAEKEAPRGGAEYEEVGEAMGAKTPPLSPPNPAAEDPALSYATLSWGEGGGARAPESPPPETPYAAIRA